MLRKLEWDALQPWIQLRDWAEQQESAEKAPQEPAQDGAGASELR